MLLKKVIKKERQMSKKEENIHFATFTFFSLLGYKNIELTPRTDYS